MGSAHEQQTEDCSGLEHLNCPRPVQGGQGKETEGTWAAEEDPDCPFAGGMLPSTGNPGS